MPSRILVCCPGGIQRKDGADVGDQFAGVTVIISTIRTREVTSKNQHPARSRADNERVSIPLTNQSDCGIDRLRAVLEVACTIADDLVRTQVLRIGDVAFAGRGDHARMPT